MIKMQKENIRKMRLDGIGYRQIASDLGLSLSTVKSFCKRNRLTGVGQVVALNNEVLIGMGLICKNCGIKLYHINGKKKKIFCSDRCRKQYWKKEMEGDKID